MTCVAHGLCGVVVMIEFGWGDYEKSYIVLTFRDRWTSDEFIKAVNSLYRDMHEVDKSINMVIDLRYSHSPPTSILSVIIRAIRARPRDFGRTIIVVQSKIWQKLYNAVTHNRQGFSVDIHFVRNVDEAYNLLLAATN